ncbi:uncharacterized protein LOC107020918 [Solanum pennellii]|uniref:Uncharacterized protein LOC107020918 n=1 Tax=Solanum pennellii TaxID=28526 RepID=A0ABM1GWE1_SOLPN|nr:uncharacterized protein LOC107020918 [Solanum pennellii]
MFGINFITYPRNFKDWIQVISSRFIFNPPKLKEALVAILDRKVRKLWKKDVASVKVLWRSQNIEKVTWEAENDMRAKYPHLFQCPHKVPIEDPVDLFNSRIDFYSVG